MENIGLIIGIIAGLIAIGSGVIAWQKTCEKHQKEFSSFNVNLAKGLTEHLTSAGKTEYIAATEDRYELAEIRKVNASPEIMEGLRENWPGIYFSIRQLCSWHSWFCKEK